MATDGKPDPAAIRCGRAIEDLRLSRGWPRAKLLVRVWNELEPSDPNYDKLTETWIARLETGRMVKIPRQTLEALCRALNCTDQERIRVLSQADRNILSSPDDESTTVAEILNYTVSKVYSEAKEILSTIIGQRRAEDLDQEEILEMTATALDMILKRPRS